MRAGLAAVLLAGCISGCSPDPDEADSPPASLPRPVTVLRLAIVDPSARLAVTGSVGAWKTEQLGFQVSGRIRRIHYESGQNVEGRTFDEAGRQLSVGDTIAELEERRYELGLSSAIAQEKSTRAEVEAQQSMLDSVIPKRIAAARAVATLEGQEFERVQGLFRSGTVLKAQLDLAQADLDAANADLEEQEENLNVERAQLEALIARSEEAAMAVEQAREDLDDTRLVAPFHGQVADVQQIEGGFLQAGQPVVTVQMMDPLKVEVSVSPETDSRISLGDIVGVHLDPSTPPLEGYVWYKDTIADPTTRTFRLTLLVRNTLVESGTAGDEEMQRLPRAFNVAKPLSATFDRKPPYFVPVDERRRTLFEDSRGYFLWRVRKGEPPETPADAPVVATARRFGLEKVRVTPGEGRMPFLQVATFRELADIGDFDPEQDLFVGGLRRADGGSLFAESEPESEAEAAPADDPPDPASDGPEDAPPVESRAAPNDDAGSAAGADDSARDREAVRQREIAYWDAAGDTFEVLHVRPRWLLRPGDYVRVDLEGGRLPAGFYVPMEAIVEQNGRYHVVAVEQHEGGARAVHVPVTVPEDLYVGSLRNIVPVAEGALAEGTPIVASGAYYVVDGEPLVVAGEARSDP